MAASDYASSSISAPELTCFPLTPDPPELVPAKADRAWMDATDQRYAYRCLPLSIANASGWELLCPEGFSASWMGHPGKNGIAIRAANGGPGPHWASSHFGHGVLTLHPGWLFRTSPGWAVWARGSPNRDKGILAPLEGLVETAWLPMPFTMNWRFTRPGTISFEKGEPFCFLTLCPHQALDGVAPRQASLDADPELKTAYEAWTRSRAAFNEQLAAQDQDAVAQGWQKHYVRGAGPQGAAGHYHVSKRRLKDLK